MAARTVLRRQPHSVTTPWGPVEGKVGWLRDGLPRFAPEFESCRRMAEARARAAARSLRGGTEGV